MSCRLSAMGSSRVLNIEQSQIQVFLEHRLPSLFILLKMTL